LDGKKTNAKYNVDVVKVGKSDNALMSLYNAELRKDKVVENVANWR
jgi:hypothetical protein